MEILTRDGFQAENTQVQLSFVETGYFLGLHIQSLKDYTENLATSDSWNHGQEIYIGYSEQFKVVQFGE